MGLVAPAMVAGRMGRIMAELGADKVIWGLGPPAMAARTSIVKQVLSLQVSQELQMGYGLPPMSMQDRQKITGLNFAGMIGIEIPKTALTRQ